MDRVPLECERQLEYLEGRGRRRQSDSADHRRARQQLAAVHSRFERPRLSPHRGQRHVEHLESPGDGGSAVQLTRSLTTHPTLSPKDGKIACWYSTSVEKPNWQLAVFPPEGGEPLRTFPLASTVVPDSNIRWSPSGSGITFLDGRGGASNIWLQPVDGSPARPLTSFTSGQIYSFDWSRDGRLIYSRGISVSDVVIIRQRLK